MTEDRYYHYKTGHLVICQRPDRGFNEIALVVTDDPNFGYITRRLAERWSIDPSDMPFSVQDVLLVIKKATPDPL